MTVFNEYARYYDMLYRDKDYAGEVEYTHNLIQKHAPDAKNILNLGCGSGRHDLWLAQAGYQVTGVDFSEKMLNMAKEASSGLDSLQYYHGDIRTLRLDQRFDVVLSLFHVMSYQTSNADLLASFRTAHEHLKPGGLFLFDCWHGPGVLTDRPTVRVKELEDDRLFITRIAQPKLHPNENIVDVNYKMFIRDKQTNAVTETQETHRMRYLFLPELELLLSSTGLQINAAFEWLTESAPTLTTWNTFFVCN